MKLVFATAASDDAVALAELHNAAAADLTRRFGQGHWSGVQTDAGVMRALREPRFSRVLIARAKNRIAGTLRLATKRPWAIDPAYFTAAKRPLYLTHMAVHPDFQKKSVGRMLLNEADAIARAWPADAIRLDAWDAEAGAGAFYAKCGFRDIGHVPYRNAPLVYFELVL